MKFDINRVYTAVNADKLKSGSKVFGADNLYSLRRLVEEDHCPDTLDAVHSDDFGYRFDIGSMDYMLVYLVSEPEENVKVYYDTVLERLLADTIVPTSGRVYFTTDNFDVAAEWIREHMTFEPVMKAYEKEKKDVQFRRQDDDDGGWITLSRTPIWDMHYMYRVKPDESRRMTNRELAKWLAQGNGQWKGTADSICTSYSYGLDDHEVPLFIKIRGWDEAEWHEPIVQED